MLRTYEETKAYVMAQGLMAGEGIQEGDIVFLTNEGAQVMIILCAPLLTRSQLAQMMVQVLSIAYPEAAHALIEGA